MLTMDWFDRSLKHGRALPESDYSAMDVVEEKNRGLNLMATLAMPRGGSVFQGLQFFITDNVFGNLAPEKEDLERIVTSGGGVVFTDKTLRLLLSSSTSSCQPENFIVVTSNDFLVKASGGTKGAWGRVNAALMEKGLVNRQVYAAEFLFTAVMRQEVDRGVGVLDWNKHSPQATSSTILSTKNQARKK